MLGRTHDLAAFTTILLAAIFLPVPEFSIATALVCIMAAMVGGLLPDIDGASSDFWKMIPVGEVLSRIVSPLIGKHRHLTHSFVGVVLVYFISNWAIELVSPYVLVDHELVHVSFMLGYVSHLVMDSFTEAGIPLFLPFRFKFGIPPIRAVRIKTGGWFEKLLVFPGLVVLNGWLMWQYYGVLVGRIVV